MASHQDINHPPAERDAFFANFVQFRNPHNHSALVLQMMMVVCALLMLLGIIYVTFVLIAMGIYHYLYDRDARHIPDYVKASVQFSSEDDELVSVGIRMDSIGKAEKAHEKTLSEVSSFEWVGPSASKKGTILEKFIKDTERHH